MRTSRSCPKCRGSRLLHITQIADRVGDLGGARMEPGPEPNTQVGQFYPWRIARVENPDGGFFTSDVMAAGLVEAYVCRGCGFTEFYTKDPEQIPIDGTIVREIEGKPRSPHR